MEIINYYRATILKLIKEKMGIMKRIIILCVLLAGMATSLSAQLKIGYILSERIRGEYEAVSYTHLTLPTILLV